MVFYFILLILFITYNFLIKTIKKDNYKFYKSISPFILVSFISNIALGINYMLALNNVQHGIDITDKVVYWIIGENSWALSLFRNYFALSLILSLSLLYTYFKEKKKYTMVNFRTRDTEIIGEKP